MSFETPLGLSTSNHLYAIKVNMDSIVQFCFISSFNPVWGRGGVLCSHHYFVTILRTILFVTDYATAFRHLSFLDDVKPHQDAEFFDVFHVVAVEDIAVQ
jgi:hypothetical protein